MPAFVSAFVPWSSIAGHKLTESLLAEKIRPYSTVAWLMMLARIDRCLLFKQVDADVQLRIAHALFADAPETLARVAEQIRPPSSKRINAGAIPAAETIGE